MAWLGVDAFMYDLFGHAFYEWWAGLSRPVRVIAALVVLGIGGIAGWAWPDAWWLWIPCVIAGGAMLLTSWTTAN